MAFRNILRNRRRSLLTGVMMVVGYVFISATFSLVDGMYGNIITIFTGQHTGHLQIARKEYVNNPSIQKTISNYEFILEDLKSYPEIRAITPRIYGEALVYLKNKSFGAEVVGFDSELESIATNYKNRVLLGHPFDKDSTYEVLVGKSIAKILEVEVSDEIALISQGADGSIANDLFTVKGIIGTDQEGKDDYRIYLPLNAAKNFFSIDNQIHEISIHLNNFHTAKIMTTKIKLRDQRLVARPWQEVEADFYKTMQTDKQGNDISIVVLMLMVGVGVLNTILMSTLERTREFGILKALGTLPRTLFSLIVLEGFLLSVICLLIGAILAFGLNSYLSHTGIQFKEAVSISGMMVSEFRGAITLKSFIVPTFILSGTAVAASFYPAFKATKISVSKALREY